MGWIEERFRVAVPGLGDETWGVLLKMPRSGTALPSALTTQATSISP